MTALPPSPSRLKTAWQFTAVLYAGLLLGLLLEHLWLRPVFHLAVLAIQLLPLVLIAPGLWQQRPRSGIWLCFVLLLYFLLMIDHLAMGGDRLFYSLLTTLIVSLFTSSLLFARWARSR